MLTCCEEKSSFPFHSNDSENCDFDTSHEAYHRFNKDQIYEGEFFRDSLHGQGTYKWKDVAVYEGGFYSNYKEGYASLSLPDNSYFEGLFIRNIPFGPGILTHSNGRQDAGFWMGHKLVRLSRAVDFIIPRLAPTSAAKIKLLQFRRLIPLNEPNWDISTDVLRKCGYPFQHFYSPYSSLIYDSRSIFFDIQAFEKTYFVNFKEVLKGIMEGQDSWESILNTEEEPEGEEEILDGFKENTVPSHCLCSQDVFVMEYKNENAEDICDKQSTEGEYELGILGYWTKFGAIGGVENSTADGNLDALGETEEKRESKSRPPNIVSWNRSEFCTEMLKQIFRFRAFEEKLTFNLGQLMLGNRTAFRKTGIKEKQCLQFLKMCSIGPAHVVKDLLCSYGISEELMDARGNNSLMFAAATDQHEVMDILLDYGVDVNTFNDENLTPLNLCLLRRMAHAKGISNWETGFLPKEIDVPTTSDYPQSQELEAQVSILSLDRIFGDGMSINDSRSGIFDSRYLTPFPSPALFKDTSEIHPSYHNRYSDESRDLSELSQITILNINKSRGSHVLLNCAHDDEPRTHFDTRRSSSSSALRETKEASQPLGSNEETPRLNISIVPKSNKRDEFLRSIKKSNKDKYLFDFIFEKDPKTVENSKQENPGKRNRKGSKQSKEEKMQEVEESETSKEKIEELVDFELSKKIAEIDKTIQKLLRRGADPNISEVPKPAIHLGVFSKDSNTVYNLLLYGANPSSQLYSNEGLLTPLHVVVLQPSSREQVDICKLLLQFGADPNKETLPEFSLGEEEKQFLDPQRGRIPLHLLCMRPDLEYADPDGNLIKIGLMLAQNTDKKRFYNGYSCLTLAMLFGNIKLLKALLESQLFDPNDVLEKDRGTALHVLVSTELQKKTAFEESQNMCDLLITAGSNPLKKFKQPESLYGTCIDYGHREIEAEKEARKALAAVKKDAKKPEKPSKEKSLVRDYLQDHEKVVEYLTDIAMDMTGEKKSGARKRKRKDSSQDSFQEESKTGPKVSGKVYDDETIKGRGKGEDLAKNKQKGGQKVQDFDAFEGGMGIKGDKGMKGDNVMKGGKVMKVDKGMKSDGELKKAKTGGEELDKEGKSKSNEKVKKGKKHDYSDNEKKGDTNLKKGRKDDEELDNWKKDGVGKGKGGKNENVLPKTKREKVGDGWGNDDRTNETKLMKSMKRKGGIEGGEEVRKLAKKNKIDLGQNKDHLSPRKGKDTGLDPKKGHGSRVSAHYIKERESNLHEMSKCIITNSSTKQFGTRSETFPEKLRQNLLKMYGNCVKLDISEFLVPYVVLRDGELYYRFQGKVRDQKEQYSLI